MLICLNVVQRILTLFFKQNVAFLAIVILCLSIFPSQMLGQTKKYVVFEHFTNTDCAPCAVQNPLFQSNILNKNKGNVHHISYHPNFPSNVDPMFLANESQNTAMESYYNIVAVPTIIANGQRFGSPGSVTQDDVFDFLEEESPVKVDVAIKTTEEGQLQATVDVSVLDNVPTGDWKLKALLVEKSLEYDVPPGNNEETEFPNVFRKMLPNTFGLTIDLNDIGSVITEVFEFEIEQDWDINNMKVIAYVQDFESRDILNSGSNEDPKWFMQTDDVPFVKTDANGYHSFNSYLEHSSENEENYSIVIQRNIPDEWQLNFTVNGVSYGTDNFDFFTNAGENQIENIQFSVNTNDVAAVGTIRLLALQTGSDFSFSPVTFRVINHCNDLVVYNDNSTAAGLGDGFNNWHPLFASDLKLTGNEKVASISHKNFVKGSTYNAFSDINSVYYNSAWAFPTLQNNFREALQMFADNGGNILISGQDFCWDVFSPVGDSNSFDNQQFMIDYFGVDFIDDGTPDNYQIHSLNQEENVFGWMGDSNFKPTYTIGTASYHSPDIIMPLNGSNATTIFNYQDDPNLPAAIKNELPNGNKTIVLGFGVEQIENSFFREQLMQTIYWWFNDSLFVGQTIVNDEKLQKNGIQMYPNPVSDVLILNNIQFDRCLVFNTSGQLVEQFNTSQGLKKLKIETTNWVNGVYLFEFHANGTILETKKLIVYR